MLIHNNLCFRLSLTDSTTGLIIILLWIVCHPNDIKYKKMSVKQRPLIASVHVFYSIMNLGYVLVSSGSVFFLATGQFCCMFAAGQCCFSLRELVNLFLFFQQGCVLCWENAWSLFDPWSSLILLWVSLILVWSSSPIVITWGKLVLKCTD